MIDRAIYHIYGAVLQAATRYRDDCGKKKFIGRNPRNRLLRTRCCGKKRPAKNLMVACYYDCIMFFCAEGKGCKAKKKP